MHSDEELLTFNNAVAYKLVTFWELHQSAPGHDQDELFLEYNDGTVLRVVAEHRTVGAALKLEPHSRLPRGRPIRNIPVEENRRQLSAGRA
jgi:hypothetical protein